jgi:DNA-binding response OmpR family regulator
VNDRDEIARLASIGITDYLCKPPQAAELLRRFDRIVREQSQWKTHRTSYDASTHASTLFLIDRDADYRAFVRSAIEPTFNVTEAASGADGLRDLRALSNLPAMVLVADGLQLLPPEAIPALIRRVVIERGARQPAIILLTESEVVPPEKAAKFNGVIHKSMGATELLASLVEARGSATRDNGRLSTSAMAVAD